ncbi:MAG: hypothetical protein DSY81_11165 [Bacillota bacterium]|nr:MAG: hypothetical protein DSY81_11165 [Bacillota bacterium]
MRLLLVLGLVATIAMPTVVFSQPANDECAGAEVIPFNTGVTLQAIDTTTATTSANPVTGAPCAGSAIGTCEFDVWYSWTPGTDGLLEASLCDLVNFDSDLLIYTGGCGVLDEVACNGDGAGCGGYTSFVAGFEVVAGTEYIIRIGGWDAASSGVGDLQLTFSELLPVSNLLCTPDQTTGVNEVLVTWDENVFYDNISIYLDVVDPANLIATQPGGGSGSAGSFLYSPAADGGHTVIVEGESGGTFAPTVSCTYFFSTPCPATTGPTLVPVAANLPFGGAVSCNAGGLHADNSYYRAFDLCNNYAVTDNIDVKCITTVFSSNPAAGGTQPVRIRLSIDINGGTVGPLSAMNLVYEEEFQVPTVPNELFNFVLGTGVVDPDGTLAGSASTLVGCLDGETLVVEIFTPDGQAAGHSLFMGIPDPAQTNPATDQIGGSFISAPACGLTEPLDMVDLGFPTNIWVMDVAWDDAGDCVCGGGVANLICQQTPGSTQWDMTWDLVGPIGSFEIEVDGNIEATLDGTETSYQTPALTAYEVQAVYITAYDGPNATGAIINYAGCNTNTAPGNSWFEGAEAIAIGDTDFSITNAVLTTGPDMDAAVCAMNIGNDGIFNDLYYCFTAGSTGEVLVSTCGGNTFDTRLAVYTGCGSDDPAGVIMCNDDAATGATTPGGTAPGSGNQACTNFAAELTFEATQGEQYLVRVGTFNQAGLGDGTLTINDCIPPGNADSSVDCSAGDVTLTWTPNPNFVSMEITRDGVSIGNPDPADSSFIDIGVADGTYVYEVSGDCGSGGNPAVLDVSVLNYTDQTDIILAMEGLQSNGNLGNIDSGAALLAALSANGVNAGLVRSSILDYPCVSNALVERIWTMTGTVPFDYRITVAEGDALGQANIDGKHVYFEGGDHFGYQHVASLFDSRDGVDDSTYDTGDGDDSFTEMNGLDSGQGLDLSGYQAVAYNQDLPLDNEWTDQLTPATGDGSGPNAAAIWVNSDDGLLGGNVPSPGPEGTYITAVFYNTDDGGKTISSGWEFGGFGGDQAILAQDYLAAFSGSGPMFKRGDKNQDGGFNIADEIYLLAALFSGGAQCLCPDSCDENDDGSVNIADAIYGLAALFSGGAAPPAPGPNTCGEDPTDDALPDCDYDENTC